ncbi:MAG: hypothetical protein HUK04_07505 [Bacteroidaceae bacterium]|uniref:hypothetical protein n=1 Tax=Fusobacterium varium TaxID=856 RepID=UPI0024319554|nr:hypothetical protein [Fusobacterium varium]MCF0171605.1 hypothetical protein [Fusobacterium varium]MCF0189318.1 hypothetical protein [Bacteroidaceae bacterium]
MKEVNILHELKNTYNKLINSIVVASNKKQEIISLPLFLDDGTQVYIYITREEEKIILSNDLFKYIEASISKLYKKRNIKKDILLNKRKFERIITDILEKNSIKYSLTLDYILKNDEDIIFEIFQYLFNIIRYYNYIFNYCIIYQPSDEEKEKAFKNAFQNFIINFNKSNSVKIKEVPKEEFMYKTKTKYYKFNEEIIFTGVSGKLHLHQSEQEMKKMLETGKYKKAKLIIDIIDDDMKKYVKNHFLKLTTPNSNLEFKLISDTNKITELTKDFKEE